MDLRSNSFKATVQPRTADLGEGGFRPEFKEGDPIANDQTHHFAGHLSAGINDQAAAHRGHKLTDLFTPADRALSKRRFQDRAGFEKGSYGIVRYRRPNHERHLRPRIKYRGVLRFQGFMTTRRRLLIAAAAPLLIPLCLGIGGWLYVDVFGQEVSEQTVMILGYLFAWSLLILNPFIPASDSQYPNAGLIRVAMYIVALLVVSVTYSLLIYALLSWHARRK